MRLVIPNMRDGYVDLAQRVLKYGERYAPRGEETREIIGATFEVINPHDSLPLGVGRKISLPFAAVEAAQLIAGATFPELLIRINPTMKRFVEKEKSWVTERNELVQPGAYGPRIKRQLPYVVERLKVDNDTRQAVMKIWDERDYQNSKDVPCTLSLQFFIRKGKLDLVTTMRSNDIFWGTAFDVFQFTQLQFTIARLLGVEVGRYIHHANSLHVYARDFEAIESLTYPVSGPRVDLPKGLGSPGERVEFMQASVQRMLRVASWPNTDIGWRPRDSNEEWYRRQLAYESPRIE